MSLDRLWGFLGIALPVLASLIGNLSSVDLAYHVRAGQMLLATGQIPVVDSFTFTAAGATWLNQQWGAQAILAATYELAGWTGLVLLRSTLIGITFAAILEACRRTGLPTRTSAWLAIGAFLVCAVALALRPQLFGMALFSVTILLLADRRAHPRRLWLLVPIVLVWANLHGSFFLGPVLVGLAWIEDLATRSPTSRQTLLVGVAATAAAAVTPFGPSAWAYAAGLSTNGFVTARISEWQPTSLRSIPGMLYFGSVAVVVVVLARRGRTAWWRLLTLAVFAAIGTYAIRGVAWWPFAAAIILAGVLAQGTAERLGAEAGVASDSTERSRMRSERPRRANLVVAGVLVAASAILLPIWRPLDPKTGAPVGVVGDAPGGVTAALANLVPAGGRIANPQPWGSWFEFALPDRLVAIDSRIEVFPAAVWKDYDLVRSGGDGWQMVLNGWEVDAIVAQDDEREFVTRLMAAGWRTAYEDSDGLVLVR